MRVVVSLAALLLATIPVVAALAQSPSAASSHPAAAAKAPYNTNDTDIGTILDDPAARAIVDKHIPGFSAGDQVDMARGMTLRAIQQFSPDRITDQVLAEIDSEFAKLATKK
jgi:hypothetical protein